MLVTEKKSMKFLPTRDEPSLDSGDSDSFLSQPDDEETEDKSAKHFVDPYLQTKLNSTRLQTRLLRVYTEAQTAIEEQGINILYLAIGFLRWFDLDEPDTPRHAPLVLVPVKLERRSAASKFRVSWSEEDIETNESLAVRLQKGFGLKFPRLSEDAEAIVPSQYAARVRKAVATSKWDIVDDVLFGFFTFGKLRMWKDLDPEAWDKATGPQKSEIVRAILLGQQMQEPSPYSDDDYVDRCEGANDLLLVKDADSSQVLSVMEVMAGRSVVIQGPPGTGKSQTITNIIANTIAGGRTVLFVSEKMAALEVVKRWLDQVGLGDSCLELHSFKARKTQVIDSIRRKIESGRPVKPDHPSEAADLAVLRNNLNEFSSAMNTPLTEGGISPHKAIGIVERHSHTDPSLELVPIPSAANWNDSQFRRNREHVSLAATHLHIVGDPQHHPWRGVMVAALLPSDRLKISGLIDHLVKQLKALSNSLEAVCKPLAFEGTNTLDRCAPVEALCSLLLERPVGDLCAMASPTWLTDHDKISALLADGQAFAKLRSMLAERVRDDALNRDYAEIRNLIQTKGQSIGRFVSRDYWTARKRVIRSCEKGCRPKNYRQMMTLLDGLCRYQVLVGTISERDKVGAAAFGKQWNSLESDWEALRKVEGWVLSIIRVMEHNSRLENCEVFGEETLLRSTKDIEKARREVEAALTEWTNLLSYDHTEAFGATAERVPLNSWIARLEAAKVRVEAVYEWIEYRKCRDICSEFGMASLVGLFDSGRISPDHLVPTYEYSAASEMLFTALKSRPVLGRFNGKTHGHVVEQFRALDKNLIETTRQYVAARLWENMPQPTLGDSDASPMNYLVNMLRRRRGIPPIRQIMERAGNIVARVKPCFMMSPMSISQFLPPDTVKFDVLVIDEASQMKPEDALGALARCMQCVVVGDSNQLPPTQFFDRLGEGDGEEENLGDVESILEASAHPVGGTRGGGMLRWHYRSRHESLIAFSNKEFYESRLHVFPSPIRSCKDLGLVGHFIENGVYARSGSRKNFVEAERVAKAVMVHAKECGHLSLGVVALSKQQQEAIIDKIEELRRENREFEWFFDTGKEEPFFVKNLENVQGDERDVIFISIGYGKDSQGYFHMNFGPINREGGWRRLNVLITRAKLRCEVFYSIKPNEIRIADLSDAESYSLRGRVALRNYLEYTETGQLDQPGIPGQDVESPFEDSVAEALRQCGVHVVPQVGVAGFRIDLGVLDPDHPGQYLLGVECDGATYHSARSARDRDRLRQEVLEKLGWRIHRVWSLEWLKDRNKEMRRLLLAIEEAKLSIAHANTVEDAREGDGKATVIERTQSQKQPRHPHELVSVPYVKYSRAKPISGHPSWIGSDLLADLVRQIVEVESPIHVDELERRVAEAFGLHRTGTRIQEATNRARRRAEKLGTVKCKGDFVWDPKMSQAVVRSRLDSGIDVTRIAPDEIRLAAEKINETSFGLSDDSLVVEVARCLGYLRASANIDKHIRSVLWGRT
jgi:very-short-patch-repair endonuclease